jgi:predicted ATP-grasp superfamily ATP-dependent carboligase
MPVFEERIRSLIKYRDLLKYKEKVLIPDSLLTFDTVNNKGLLGAHMERYGIPAPKSKLLGDQDDLKLMINELEFPLLTKPPLDTGGGDGIVKYDNRRLLEDHYKNQKLQFPVVLEQYIEGFDTGCNVLCREGKILAYTIQQGILYERKPFSPQIGLKMVHQEEVLEIATRLMASLKWTGLANIDLIYDIRHKQCLVLEINPRYWLTLEGSLIAGVNFPWLYCQTVVGASFAVPEYKEAKFFNLKGLVVSVKKDLKNLFSGELLWIQSPLKFALQDPLPMVYHFFWRTKNILVDRIRKKKINAA